MSVLPGQEATPLLRLRIKVFQTILVVAAVGLFLICLRTWLLDNRVAWMDFICLQVFILIYITIRNRPQWFGALVWIAFAALLADVLDGMNGLFDSAITPTHILIPALVIYGALMGEVLLALVGMLAVFTIYAITIYLHYPLEHKDAMLISNLGILTVILGLSAYLVWRQHAQLEKQLSDSAESLRGELDVNDRLIRLVTHDIANPLTVINSNAELIKMKLVDANTGVSKIVNMAHRISGIINSLKGLQLGHKSHLKLERIEVNWLYQELQALFRDRLEAKDLSFQLKCGGGLSVMAHPQLLSHSVLGNFLVNAIKFSSRGSEIELAALRVGSGLVRIEVRDRGHGVDDDVLKVLVAGDEIESRAGTEGESGSGSGIKIAYLCARRMDGEIAFSQRPGGGLLASVTLQRSAVDATAAHALEETELVAE